MTNATSDTTAPVHLPQRGLLTLDDAARVQIECRSGSLWITLDDDPRDFIVDAGECFASDQRRRLIVYALQASELRVLPRQHETARHTPLATNAVTMSIAAR